MFEAVDAFFGDLGLAKVSEEFWEESKFWKYYDRLMACQSSAWDFYDRTDFRFAKNCY